MKKVLDKQVQYIREDKEGMRQKIIQLDRVLFGALIAIIFVFLGNMLSITGSKQLEYAALAFSIAVPTLAMSIFSQSLNAIYGFALKDRVKMAISAIGVFSAIIGVGCAFWHLSQLAAILFAIASTVSFIIVFRYHIRLGIAFELEIDKKPNKAN